MGPVAAAVYAAAHEAHGVAANAPGYFLAAPVSAGQWGGAAHQPHPARLGHLLCGGPIQSVFLVYLLLGRSRAAAALAAEPEASGLRVVSMALAAGLADGRGLSRLSRAPVSASSRFYSVERWTPSTGQLIDVAKWNLLRDLPVKMRGAEDDKAETAKSFASL